MKVPWTVEPIRGAHKRDAFSCGEPALDDFLRLYARQNEKNGVARTFVAIRDGALLVEGYFTLRTGEVHLSRLPEAERKNLPRYPVPVIHLARLAVSKSAQGLGLGELLLGSAMLKAVRVAEEVGVHAVEVFAKNERACAFYKKFGFKPLVDDPLHLYQSIQSIRAAGERRS